MFRIQQNAHGEFYFRKYLLIDPTELEERCMDGKLVVGMNKHREISTMQLSGNILLLKDQVLSISWTLSLGWLSFKKVLFLFKDQPMCKYSHESSDQTQWADRERVEKAEHGQDRFEQMRSKYKSQRQNDYLNGNK